MLTHAGLFEGIGGFPLAAERVGMETVWSAENDKHASKVLAHHWPDVPNLGDVHDVRDAPRVDVLTGGFPCQDYSVAGTRGGLAGDRGALWWQYHRLIAEQRPAWVVGENVPGLLSSRGGADFETIVGSLTECGYGVAWAVLDAQYFGVAQRRRRVFIVGHSGGEPRPEILALSEGMFGHPEPSREAGQGVAGSLETRLTEGRQRVEENHLIPQSFDWQAGGGSDRTWLHDAPGRTRSLTANRTLAVAFSAGNHESSYGIGLSEEHTPPLRAGESRTNQVPTVAFSVGSSDVAVGGDVSPSLTGRHGDPGGVAQSSVRRLTPLECERLQGFPDGWTDIPGNSDTQRYQQLGNAVAVPVAEWIMRRIVGAG